MSSTKITILIAIVASAITVMMLSSFSSTPSNTPKKETAFDRIMRTGRTPSRPIRIAPSILSADFGRLAAEIYAQSGVYVTAQSIRSWVLAADRAAS